jgi:hypothetical protein
MRDYLLSQLGDAELLRGLGEIAAQDRSITAVLLAHLAEVDSRRLFAPAGYPSMQVYCIHELRFSEDAANRCIRAARKAREYPAIFAMVADGRLDLSAVLALGSWLRPENAAELLASAAHKTKKEIEELIAERFPRTESRCTYTTESGQRCPARDRIQYDHIEPVARGGEATVENIRLRCATHDQYEAERTFGAEFMTEKREEARRERAAAREQERRPARTPSTDPERDVTPWLQELQCRSEHIRLAAAHCESLPEGTSLDDRVREAIRFVGRLRYPRAFSQATPATPSFAGFASIRNRGRHRA